MSAATEDRPGLASEATEEEFATPPSVREHFTNDELCEQCSNALVVVVRTDDDHYRRRTFLTLRSAERAARKAEDRGHSAEVILCKLVPIIRSGDAL